MGVCLDAGVDYMRFRNWKFGSVKTLSDDEIERIAKVLVELSPNKQIKCSENDSDTRKTMASLHPQLLGYPHPADQQ